MRGILEKHLIDSNLVSKITLRQDSRDLHIADYFGSLDAIPDEMEFDRGLTNPVESSDEVDCTAISGTDVATDQTGTKYSVSDLWSLTPKTNLGADPRDSMAVIVEQGLQPINGGPRDTRWINYMRADGDSGDYYVNTQSSMMLTNSSTTIASNFYLEWRNIGPNGILPEGKTRITGHDYKISGWKDGMFHVKHWLGYFVWMPKEVFNTEMNKSGTTALIPTTREAEVQRRKKFYQSIQDGIVNAWLKLKEIILQLKTIEPMPTQNTPSKITIWAYAISDAEGASLSSHNPGNLKFSPLTASWGATQGRAATDGGHLCQFSNYQQGFSALCNFLILGCHDELKAFHQARTLQKFTEIYAGNPPQQYIDRIATSLGVPLVTDISTFLSP